MSSIHLNLSPYCLIILNRWIEIKPPDVRRAKPPTESDPKLFFDSAWLFQVRSTRHAETPSPPHVAVEEDDRHRGARRNNNPKPLAR
jgi:hypothetical protein